MKIPFNSVRLQGKENKDKS